MSIEPRMGHQQMKRGNISNLAVAPSGQRRDGLWSRKMSRFGASHGCDWEPWLAPKRLSIRFYLLKVRPSAQHAIEVPPSSSQCRGEPSPAENKANQ